MNKDKNWELLKKSDLEIYEAIYGEEKRQSKGIELILQKTMLIQKF